MVFIVYVNHDVVAKVNHDQTILFIVHLDYVNVFEDSRDQDNVFRSLRSPRRRGQGQLRPNVVVYVDYEQHCLVMIDLEDDAVLHVNYW